MPKILGGRLPGKIGLCRHKVPDFYRGLKHSSIAQLVEHAAVNRRVVGSSPTWGAKNTEYTFCVLRIFHSINGLEPTTSCSKFVCKFGRNSPLDCFVAGCTTLVRCGKVPFRRMCMCAPYFFLFIESNQRQAAPNLAKTNLAETVRWTVS